jgi:hypothetical protein
MIESALKGFALLVLTGITIDIVKWLFRHLTALVLMVAILGTAAWLMH